MSVVRAIAAPAVQERPQIVRADPRDWGPAWRLAAGIDPVGVGADPAQPSPGALGGTGSSTKRRCWANIAAGLRHTSRNYTRPLTLLGIT